MDRKLIINRPEGQEVVEQLNRFTLNDNGKEYLVYTKNEKDDNGNTTIYINEVIVDEYGIKLASIESDEDWNNVKEVLRNMAREESEE